MEQNPLERFSAAGRAVIYAGLLVTGAAQAGFEAADLDAPSWLVFLAAAIIWLAGGTALTHLGPDRVRPATGDDTPATEDD